VSITKSTLYIVATPIGNLQDLSPRGQAILREVDLIAAEDTQHSRRLLNYFGITTPLQSLHEHNEKHILPQLIKRLCHGESLALISDAGTPTISDPGHQLVQAVHIEHFPVIAIPGPCALISALSVSGFPTDHFVFDGFLPAKTSARRHRLQELAEESRTLAFYEAPHRLMESLNDMVEIFGAERMAVLAKELTKVFETVYRATLANIVEWLNERPERQQGEFVIVIQGAAIQPKVVDAEVTRIFHQLREELPLNQAARLTSKLTGVSKNTLYQLGLESEE
jgi:16S rRNA (cytidine1402-2'-O)-methyltransferase